MTCRRAHNPTEQRWALKGDAAQRSIMEWHFGWSPAQQAAGKDWMIPLLSGLLTDSYSAVRYIAFERLCTFEDYNDLKCDFDGPAGKREEVVKQVLDLWEASNPAGQIAADALARLLLTAPRARHQTAVNRLLKEQDSTPISIVE